MRIRSHDQAAKGEAMKKKVVMAPRELGEFEFQCKGCKEVHKRSFWSVAHYDTPHTFECPCGYITTIVGDDSGDGYPAQPKTRVETIVSRADSGVK